MGKEGGKGPRELKVKGRRKTNGREEKEGDMFKRAWVKKGTQVEWKVRGGR